MRELVAQLLSNGISRRGFVRRLVATGVSAAAANRIAESVTAFAQAPGAPVSPEAVRLFTGTGAEHFAEQLIASGVKYIFGNSASEDAFFYEALVDRPQLQYILTPHEGPGAAMAAGYIKASGRPTIVMQAAVVGLTNALGQMFNCWKEQTPLVFYSYRTEDSLAAGRDGFEELPGQEQLTEPMTKLTWSARAPEQIPETVRRAFRVAWTPPHGPTYMNWHSDFTEERFTAEIIRHDQVDPRMRVRPNPVEVQRAAKLLVDAQRPLLIVGDEVYKAKAFDKVVELAELLALPVTQARQVHASFPQQHPLWVGSIPGGRVDSLAFPTQPDVVINIGNKLQHNSPAPIVSRRTAFIDMRNDAASIGNVMTTAAPLVADVAYGTEDLLAAVRDVMTPALKARVAARSEEVRAFSTRARQLRAMVSRNPLWDASPLEADRVTWELAQWAEKDAIIVHEGGSLEISHSFEFDPRGGRELFFYYAAHLGTGVGTAAGVQLARPGKQVVLLVGDGSFIFGPTALWNMARLQLPVLTVVYNNHAYGGPHNRAIANLGGGGRAVDATKFVHDYLGKPDMDMSAIARGFGVEGERATTPTQLKEALGRARRKLADGKPYLLDVEVARHGPGWTADPWIPAIQRT
ncbi:MAG: thiamine pyrophosphate-binding protein [Acidobacteria bacterium]|nr:thiamine pyrophosphate-binding protein [Acidobacteriota bacterium]